MKPTEDVSKLHKNTMQLSPEEQRMLDQEDSDIKDKENSIESYFEGVSDEKLMSDLDSIIKKQDRKDLKRMKREGAQDMTITDKDREFKSLIE